MDPRRQSPDFLFTVTHHLACAVFHTWAQESKLPRKITKSWVFGMRQRPDLGHNTHQWLVCLEACRDGLFVHTIFKRVVCVVCVPLVESPRSLLYIRLPLTVNPHLPLTWFSIISFFRCIFECHVAISLSFEAAFDLRDKALMYKLGDGNTFAD